MVPFLAIFLGLVLFIEETPFDLITRYSIDDSFKAFSRIAEINNK